MPVAFRWALDESITEVDPASGQVAVFQKLEMIMTKLADLTRRVQTSEDQVRDKTTTSPAAHPLLGPTEGTPRFPTRCFVSEI